MRITFNDLVAKHGDAKAEQIGRAIADIHGGMGFQDFKHHRGGLDFTAASDAQKAKVENLMAPEPEPKETKKEGAK